MIDTGIVRKVDDLGRIVIPMELRRTLDIKVGDPISIFTEGDKIILVKHSDGCVLCGDKEGEGIQIHDKRVCNACVELMGGR